MAKKKDLEEYKEFVKKERKACFNAPYDLVYSSFLELGYDKKDEEYFRVNASEIIENLRRKTWEKYVPIEKEFTSKMLLSLVDEQVLNEMTASEAVLWFTESFPEHIYALNLSNTQSRRSRAGKEFECIIELVLIGAGISLDSQGNIGKKRFIDKGLGKLVDVVIPGIVEFLIDKNDTLLLSAKTTLRERWQEVPEEMSRTGAKDMYLITLDEFVSGEVLDTLYESNIRLVTLKSIKEKCYGQNSRIFDFESLIKKCNDNSLLWTADKYSEDYIIQITDMVNKQAKKHENHSFVYNYYLERLNDFK